MNINILVNGATGKMGRLAVSTLSAQSEFFTVTSCGHQDNLAEMIKRSQAQVVLDLTNSESVFKNTEIIIAAGVHPVIGTSGLLKKDIAHFQQICKNKKLGGIIVPNFSLGAVLLMKQAQEIVRHFPEVEIIEMHHDGKLDSPSGTAIRAAEMLAEIRVHTSKHRATKETISGARGACYEDIPIHAIRLPGLVAHLQIMFGGLGETLTLRHDTIDRQCFMPGVVLACKKVMVLKELVVGLEQIL